MAKIGLCDCCHQRNILGYKASTSQWLCPKCSAEELGAKALDIEVMLVKQWLACPKCDKEELKMSSHSGIASNYPCHYTDASLK